MSSPVRRRMTSISDLPGLAPRLTVGTQPAPTPDNSADNATDPKQVDTKSPRGTGGTSADRDQAKAVHQAKPRPASETPIRESSFLAPAEIRDKLRAHAATKGFTLTQVVLIAVETTAHQLPDLIAAQSSTGAISKTNLFPALEGRSRRRATGQANVTISMRINVANLEVLDDLVNQVGAGSRSELLTVALRSYLDSN